MFALFVYVAGHAQIARYLQVLPVSGVGEVTVFCAAMAGAGLGFLWFNAYPAQVFMGDIGSLSLGGALGFVAVLCKQEFILMIVGGVFVLETLSVILQVATTSSPGVSASFAWLRCTIILNSKASRNQRSSSGSGFSPSSWPSWP